MDNILELVAVIRESGVVPNDRMMAVALEAQRQQVLWAGVVNAGRHGPHYNARAVARTMLRKAYKGTVLKDTWDVVEETVTAMGKWNYGHQGGNAPYWYYDSREAPREVLIAAGLMAADTPVATCGCGDPHCDHDPARWHWCAQCHQHEER